MFRWSTAVRFLARSAPRITATSTTVVAASTSSATAKSSVVASAPAVRRHKVMHTAASVEEMLRKGLPIAEMFDVRVLRVGYDDRKCNAAAPAHGTSSYVSATLLLPYDPRSLRPGGSINGPVMMMMADAAMVTVSWAVTPNPLSVTTNLNINFLSKPMAGKAVVAEARLIKGGKRLHSFAVDILAIDPDVLAAHDAEVRRSSIASIPALAELTQLVAFSTGTYSIP